MTGRKEERKKKKTEMKNERTSKIVHVEWKKEIKRVMKSRGISEQRR